MKRLSCLVIPGDPLSSLIKAGNFELFIDRFKFYADNLGKVVVCNFDTEAVEYAYPNLEILNFKPKGNSLPSRLWQEMVIVRRLLQDYHIDFMRRLDSPVFLDRAILGVLAKAMGSRLVVSIHGSRGRLKEGLYFKKDILTRMMLFIAEKTSGLTSNITFVVDEMYIRELGWKNMHIVPNFVDPDLFALRESTKDYDMIYVGTIKEKKGIKYLLEVLKLVRDRRPQASLAVCGFGELVYLLDSVEGLSYLGPIAYRELPRFYNRSKVCVIASLHEGFCMPVIEAQACQVPVVAFDLPPFHHNSLVGESSFLVELKDTAAMAQRIIYLLDNEAIRKQMGIKGRAFVKEKFDRGMILEKEVRLIRDLFIDDMYQTLEKGRARHLHRIRMQYLTGKIREIKAQLGRGLRILDMGCGDGVVTQYILNECSKDDNLFAIDFDEIRISRALRNCPQVKFVCADALDLPFEDNYFDLIINHHVIEHIRDDHKVLVECLRILKEGGFLILGVPNEDSLPGKLMRWLHPATYRLSEHIHFYSLASMQRLLRATGFKVVEATGFGFLLPLLPIHNLILANRFLFKAGNWFTQRLRFSSDSLFLIAEKASSNFSEPQLREELKQHFERIYRDILPRKRCYYERLINYTLDDPENKILLRLLTQVKPLAAESKMLDVGCGFGGFVIFCCQQGLSCYGLDKDEFELDIARRRLESAGLWGPDVLHRGKAEELPFPDACFDAVSMFRVLEHAQNPRKALEEAIRVVKPGGAVFIYTTNYARKIYEPHYYLAFLHFLPNRIAKLYLRIFGRDVSYLGKINFIRAEFVLSILKANRVKIINTRQLKIDHPQLITDNLKRRLIIWMKKHRLAWMARIMCAEVFNPVISLIVVKEGKKD
jgi:ubiquinone/menaquinone biosynthesis C-methylase UbiE